MLRLFAVKFCHLNVFFSCRYLDQRIREKAMTIIITERKDSIKRKRYTIFLKHLHRKKMNAFWRHRTIPSLTPVKIMKTVDFIKSFHSITHCNQTNFNKIMQYGQLAGGRGVEETLDKCSFYETIEANIYFHIFYHWMLNEYFFIVHCFLSFPVWLTVQLTSKGNNKIL